MTNHHHVIVSDVIQLVISGTCDKPEFNHNVAGGKGVGKEISLYMAAVSFVTYSKHLALFAVIAYSVIIAVTDGCTDDYECDIEMNQVCCNRECVYGLSCVGGYYTSYSNCSSDESCFSSECSSGDCWHCSCSNDSEFPC